VMTEPVAEMCERLVKAVNVIMDPETNQTLRLEALKFCEEFKETSSLCIPCGLKLAAKTQPAVIRHFGLQILEHVIKYRWNNMQVNEKVQLKDCAMQLLSTGTSSVLQEESHIKDVLSRITVEMIKREWPQNWPDMLKEMEALTSQGEAQTELVMLILLRLAEDVITFQTLPTQRRRDIQQTLTQNMDSIFTFLMAILHINVEDFRKTVRHVCFDTNKARVYCRVSVATLNTLAGYIDWVSLAHITNNNCQLLEILCLLLNEPELQLEAAECLLIAISRKMDWLSLRLVERRYIFLKRLCQVLCAMGSQLCFLAVSTDIEIPPNLCKYTEALMAFTTHTSHFLKMSTLQTWGALFRHDVLSKDPVILEMAKKYMKTCMTNLIKTGYPSRNDHPSCMYSSVDFDSDEDFHSFSVVFRAQQSDMLRLACRMAPLEAFQIAAEWLQFQITSPVDVGDSTTSSGGLCSMLSPSVTQWDAETIFMECMVGQIFKHLETEKLPIDASTELLQALLKYETKDPLILSCVLTNTSALFPFVIHRPHLLSLVLDKLFRAVTFETSQNKMVPRTRAVKNVRRHACSSIIRICRDYPDFLVPCFDIFYEHTKKLLASDPTITYMEKCSLMEALVLISNQFKDFEKQKAFLDELLAPVVADWTSEDLRVLATPAMYLSFIGADQVLTEKTREAEAITCNRARLSFCLFVLSGVIKRAKWPSDMEEAKAGGFVVGCTSGGEPIYRNPCTSIFLAMLPNLFVLIRTQISLFLPENMARLSETFSAAHEIMDQEKNVVLGISQPLLDIYDSPVYKSNLERMQGFFATIYDICFHALGNACQSLLQEFYSIEGLTQEISTSVFGTFDHVPDHRLRPMIHILFIHSSLVQYCPPEYHESLLCPLLGPLFAYILQVGIVQRLTWAENNVTQEMLEEHLVILLTREVIEFLSKWLHFSTIICLVSSIEFTSIYMSLLTLSFTAISWKDTTICNRSSSLLCWTLLRPATAGNLLPEAVTWFFTSVLKALQVHGQHEVCNNTLNQLAMLIYEALRPRYAELRTVMMQVPNINMDSLDQYDHKLLDPKAQKAGEKKRKDQFKRLLAGTIGKALCEQFKKEVHIKNLPTLFKRPKDEKDIMNETLGLAALFAPTTEAL
uniref:Exportin 5 n=1 Tax=Neogobius melanostomus TaxID=47308 RepID=A0A8C6UXA7_9GOBI